MAEELKSLATISNAEELACYAYFIFGAADYIIQNYERAAASLKTASMLRTSMDTKIRVLRLWALSLAYSGKEIEFKRVEGQLHNLLGGETADLRSAPSTYEGLARGKALLGLGGADKTLERGWNSYDRLAKQIGDQPYLFVQLCRSELEVVTKQQPSDISTLLGVGAKVMQLQTARSYPRYTKVIVELLNQFLN
jgi:hypothetical protein